ncbi:hypothetical protein BJ170DRAFT_608355 [Xylariales sp. AK1849]|nr:hypothetical protein BJ170DRAFT_608355 [Xylariales sp. AK1849]
MFLSLRRLRHSKSEQQKHPPTPLFENNTFLNQRCTATVAMASVRGKRIQANCRLIWGEGDYDIDVETDDLLHYIAFVKKDFGTSLGPPLTASGLCNSSDQACRELDRMLGVWAEQVLSQQPMTNDQRLETFGGPDRRNEWILKRVFAEQEKPGVESSTNA